MDDHDYEWLLPNEPDDVLLETTDQRNQHRGIDLPECLMLRLMPAEVGFQPPHFVERGPDVACVCCGRQATHDAWTADTSHTAVCRACLSRAQLELSNSVRRAAQRALCRLMPTMTADEQSAGQSVCFWCRQRCFVANLTKVVLVHDRSPYDVANVCRACMGDLAVLLKAAWERLLGRLTAGCVLLIAGGWLSIDIAVYLCGVAHDGGVAWLVAADMV